MRYLLLALALFSPLHAQSLANKEILVIYNQADPESKKLADYYTEARDIPASQVLGLELSTKQDISRDEYNASLLLPLRQHFETRRWWQRARDPQGIIIPTANRIRAIVLMRGVPLTIQSAPSTAPPAATPPTTPADPISPRDEASVDSELALFGVESLPAKGVLKNAFYDSKTPFSTTNLPHLVLTTRIDGPTYAICEKMISDAIATEKTGLWGRAYVDIANKFPQGDQWLADIINRTNSLGIPTVTDRFNDTLPKNYPMTEAAIYYGWYDWNVSGPFLNPAFRFRPGAIAVHLHSFSGQQIRDPSKNWCAPLLSRGAAATVGNVYEPYLHLTHHFNILHARLLDGWTFAEAAWAAMPVASWQGIALGDPLYRPFLHLDGTGKKRNEDRDFRALRAAARQWPDKSTERRKKIAEAANNLSSGNLAEGLALDYREAKDTPNAQLWLRNAKNLYVKTEDKLRQDIQLIAIEREQNRNQVAILELRNARARYGPIPETEAISGWLDILDPPPPPLADPTKTPVKK
ncbi:MAG: TIGR03790 family protein [Armatimonadetes bacterium]|nr:TIGR03790 family protein [Akkermansiaceae bacterium]